MEYGNSFEIRQLWDGEFDEVGEREARFSEGLNSIENDYKSFLEQNGSYDDGVSYLQFIADNTEEVLGFFQNNDVTVIDEKYATIIFFLEDLHKDQSKQDEFLIANQLFWASIIAGYLRSEKPTVDTAENGSRKEYFLDTSILLGMLGLSTKQKEEYATEIKNIIQSSGGIIKAHPMTLEEIKTILNSVEESGNPDPGTDIAEAWVNHDLTINKLAKYRLNLQSKLEKLGVQIFPLLGPDECKRKAYSYKGKKIVEELAIERSKTHRSYSPDNFREIHDLFMDDYIKERRKEKLDSDDIVFVTANRDLISFMKRIHPSNSYMMSTGRVVLDLWMHNVRPAEISSCALTETMARCLDQHNIRVRNKIMEVSKFFNENKGNFDTEVYQDFIKKLYRRARNVINTVETNPDNQDTLDELTKQRILDAVKADQDFYDKKIKEEREKSAELANQLIAEKIHKEALLNENIQHQDHVEELNKRTKELKGEVAEVNKKLSLSEEKVAKEKEERQKAEKIIELYKERDELVRKLAREEAEFEPLKKEGESAFSNWLPTCLIIIGVIFILIALAIICYAVRTEKYWLIATISVLVPFSVFCFNRANTLNDNKVDRHEKAFKKWETEKACERYRILKESISDINNRLEEIEKQLD